MAEQTNGNGKKDTHHLNLMKHAVALYGRIPGKYLVLTPAILEKELNINQGKAEWVMSPLITAGKIASLNNTDDNIVYVARRIKVGKEKQKFFRYTAEELVNFLNAKYFNDTGKFLKDFLKNSKYRLLSEILAKRTDELGLPPEILRSVIKCFVQIGLLNLTAEGRLSLTARGKNNCLDYAILKSAFLSQRFTDDSFMNRKRAKITSLADTTKVYAEHNEETRAQIIAAESKKSGIKFAYLTEILAGHQDLDMPFLMSVLEHFKTLPKEELPDVLIVSGLVQGAFQHRQKNRRLTLVQSLKSENEQFKIAKLILVECAKLGIRIIYNRGNDDKEICEMRTVDAINIMNNSAKPQKDAQKRSLNYKQLDDLKQTKVWDFHFRFQWDVAFPYMLRSGRRLYSADEMSKKFGRRIEEYLVLLETYLALASELPVPDSLYTKVLEIDNIPLPQKQFNDYTITDDFDMTAKLASREFILWEKHNMTLTPISMVGDPLGSVRALVGQLEASGSKVPDAFIIEHQRQETGEVHGNTFMACTPGMHTSKLKRNSFGMIQNDPSHRMLTTRRDLFYAGANAFAFTDDGRIRIDFMNENFMKKALISPERVSVAFLSDWQNGSVTARPDLQVIMLDYLLHSTLPVRKLNIFFGGDIGQFRNYPEMPNENVRMGLVRSYDQQSFVRQMLLLTLRSVPVEYFKNLERAGVTVGNHEWNTSHKTTGDTHSGFLPHTLSNFFDMIGAPVPVKYYDKISTKNGDHFNVWAGKEVIAGYGFLFQHMIMEKAGKGSGGSPVQQFRKFMQGMGELLQSIDIMATGHWHTPMYLCIGKKLAVINGALAGISGYEYMLGCRSTIGTSMVHLGAGRPVTLEFLTPETLYRYQPKGYFSAENLAKLGFVDDPGFDLRKHGFARIPGQPQSAIQKALWKMIDFINWDFQSTL